MRGGERCKSRLAGVFERVLLCTSSLGTLIFSGQNAKQQLSGRSAAWLARLVRDQEAGGSNPLAPTILFNRLSRAPGLFITALLKIVRRDTSGRLNETINEIIKMFSHNSGASFAYLLVLLCLMQRSRIF